MPYLTYGDTSGLSRILDAHRAGRGRPDLTPRMTSLLAATNLEMAKEGLGVAWLPLSLAQGDVAAGRLVRAGDAGLDAAVQIVVYRPRSRLSPHAERFWEEVARSGSG